LALAGEAASAAGNEKRTYPMPKIYTRTGDSGETALFAGGRVRKDDVRVETIGTIDEINAAIGVVRMELARGGTAPAGLNELLGRLQHSLFELGGEIAMPRAEVGAGTPRSEVAACRIGDAHVGFLEAEIDRYEAQLTPLKVFILPGGCPAAAALHLARCICRRAERRLVELAAAEPVRPAVLGFVNRLSDLLFVLARAANQANRVADVAWSKEQSAQSREQGVDERGRNPGESAI
jgi:cob(I)alamin adenosyltransferase